MNPERQYREAVNRHLPSSVYHQGMGGTATSGTPDSYYEGPDGILWVEWKWSSAKRPTRIPQVTALQTHWLQRAFHNNVSVAVICGTPSAGYIFPGLSWSPGRISAATVIRGEKKSIANWITAQVTKL